MLPDTSARQNSPENVDGCTRHSFLAALLKFMPCTQNTCTLYFATFQKTFACKLNPTTPTPTPIKREKRLTESIQELMIHFFLLSRCILPIPCDSYACTDKALKHPVYRRSQ